MRVLVLSTVFPNPKQPNFGIFVWERTRRVAAHCPLAVVAPIPWFPFNRWIRGAHWHGFGGTDHRDGVPVHRPRVLSVPRYLKVLDGVLYWASLAPVVARLRRAFPFDLLDAHFIYPDGFAAALLGKTFGCPVVTTLRGSIVRLATYPAHRPLLRIGLAGATRLLAVSRSLKDVAVRLGVAAERITVVPNGVDTTVFRPIDRRTARDTLGLPQDATILLSVGGLNEGKGHHRVVTMLPDLLRRHPALMYVVVGAERPGDSTRPLIQRLVRHHGLDGRVVLAGEQPHHRIPWWMGAADLFCLATRSEGWANVLLEALACGRPVVSTRVGGNAEVVPDERLGLLVAADDDGALRDAIGEAIERPWDADALVSHAAAHSWEASVGTVLGEFRRALAPLQGSPRDPVGAATRDEDG